MSTMLHHLPLIGFCKLPTRLFNEHSLVHKVLEILVIVANDLDLQARVETSLKTFLMCIIRGDVLLSILRELGEPDMLPCRSSRDSFLFILTFPSGTWKWRKASENFAQVMLWWSAWAAQKLSHHSAAELSSWCAAYKTFSRSSHRVMASFFSIERSQSSVFNGSEELENVGDRVLINSASFD